MAEHSGFFNAELDSNNQYDRTYAAEQFARYFSAFIGNGVYITPSTQLKVVPVGNELAVYVSIGNAYINGYFYSNDDNLYKKLSNPNGANPRIDRIVLRLDLKTRKIYVDVLEGVASSSPVAKGILRNQYIYELALADVYVGATALTIVDADITDLRMNSLLCGYVHGVVDQIDTTSLFNQFQASFNALYNSASGKFNSLESKVTNDFYTLHNQQDSTFKSWFENIKSQLSGDIAANLQRQIDENRERLSFDSIDTSVGGSSFTNGEDGHMLVTDWTRNLLHTTLETTTKNGVTCTANGDGTYTLSGTSVSTVWTGFVVSTTGCSVGDEFKLVGCPTGGSLETYKQRIDYFDSSGKLISGNNEIGTGVKSIVPENAVKKVVTLYINAKYAISGKLLFKPMLATDLNATYDNYVPYNKKITNLLNSTLGTTKINGITFTANSDGTYTLNGTSTSAIWADVGFVTLPKGTYKLVGWDINNVGKKEVVMLYVKENTSICDYGNGGSTFTLNEETLYHISIVVEKDTTLNKVVIKPMITENLDASYNDFVRYGVSHRNLLIPTLQTTTVNGVTITNNGDGTYKLVRVNGEGAITLATFTLEAGIYKVLGCASNGTWQDGSWKYAIQVVVNDKSVGYDTGSGLEITLQSKSTVKLILYCGINCPTNTPLLFKPMVTTNLNATYDDFVKGQKPTTMKSCGKNLFNVDGYVVQGILNESDGVILDNPYWLTTGHIEVKSNTTYAYSIDNATDNFVVRYVEYDENKKYIKYGINVLGVHGNTTNILTTTPDTKYVRISFGRNNKPTTLGQWKADGHWIQIEEGTKVTSYEPHAEESIDVYDETETPAFGLMSHKGVTHIISNANIKATYPTSEGGVSFMDTLYNHKDMSDNIRDELFAELQTNINVLQTQVNTNKSQISANKTQIDANKSTLDTHQIAINNQQETISNHTNQLDAMSGDISTINGKVNNLTDSLETTERNVSTLTTKCSSLETTQTDMSAQLDHVKGVMNYEATASYLANLDDLIYVPGVWVSGNLFDVHFSGAFLSRFVGSSGGYRYVMLGITLYNGSQVTLPSGAANKIKICSLGGFIGDAHIDTSGGTVLPSLTWGGIFIQLTCSKDSSNRDTLYMYGNVPDTQTIPAGTTIVLPVITVQTEPLSAS